MRILAFIEAQTLTGPAKNLLRFGRLAAANREEPVRVDIATFGRGPLADRNDTAFAREVADAGLKLFVIPERFRFDLRVPRLIETLVKDVEPDIIQTHGVKSHFLVNLISRPAATKWIAFHHGYTATDVKMKLYNQLDRVSLRNADQVVTVCTAFARDLQRIGVTSSKTSVLPNAVDGIPPCDPQEVLDLRRELGLTGSEKVLLAVGRMSKEKGHAVFLEALKILRGRNTAPDLKAVFVGEGPEWARLSEMVDRLGLSGQVVFAGYRKRIGPFYALATAMVLPSFSEGCPNVLLEAMAAGTPSIATNVGGVPDVVSDNVSALVVAPGRAEPLADALQRMLSDESLARRLATRAQQEAADRFTPEVHRESVMRIYRTVLARS